MFNWGAAITAFGITLEIVGLYGVYKKYPSYQESRYKRLKRSLIDAEYNEEEHKKEHLKFKNEAYLLIGGLLAQLIALLFP